MKKNEKVEANVVRPGMYYHSDGTISAEVLSEKQISGVVGWVDRTGRHGLVLGLRETKLPWSSDHLNVRYPDRDTIGRENTRLILKAAQKYEKKAEAAEWCAAYAFDGLRAGEAFLPGRDEWLRIFRNFGAVQEALGKINRPLLKDDWYWSSSQDDALDAWGVSPSEGYMGDNGKKYDEYPVRCIWEF